MFREFVNFERNERARANHSEVFGPALTQKQASAFSQKEAGVDERAHAQQLELVRVHIQTPGQNAVYVVVLGVDAENVDPMLQTVRQIAMKIPQGAEGHQQQGKSLYEFEDGNQK